jgi:hypothetical protein
MMRLYTSFSSVFTPPLHKALVISLSLLTMHFVHLQLVTLLTSYYAYAAVNFADNTCDQWKAQIEEEMAFAVDMALTTADNVQKGGYFDDFFAESLRVDPEFSITIGNTFGTIGDIAAGGNSYQFQVTCNFKAPSCKKGFKAFMVSTRGTT